VPRRRPGLAVLLLAAILAAASAAAGEPDKKGVGGKLEDVERAIAQDRARAGTLGQQSATLAREIDSLRRQSIAAAQAVQAQEQNLTGLEGTLDELRAAEEEKNQDLQERRTQLVATLGALERLAVYPPEAMAAMPERPVDTLRSALLLRTAVPEVEARARRLRADLDSLRSLQAQMKRERDEIVTSKQHLEEDRRQLTALVAAKAELLRQTESARQQAQERVAMLSAQAKDLRELLDRIDAEDTRRAALARAKPTPPPGVSSDAPSDTEKLAALPPAGLTIRPMSGAQGRLTLPARGEVIRQFGDPGDFGANSEGITIRTRPDAQVVAPYDGRVVFSGPFRGYGQILIIEHSEGYHTLLAGLSRVDAVAGQWVLAGEPVGVMGQRAGGAPELYVELRRNGRPINPLPWLAFHNGKVSG